MNAISKELATMVAEINQTAGYEKARIHTGELMRPVDAPDWMSAMRDAYTAVKVECRPSSEKWRDVHLGDWFDRTVLIDTDTLPSTVRFGWSSKFSPSAKKIIRWKSIRDYRFPRPVYWHEAWRPTIEAAMLKSGAIDTLTSTS